MLVLRMEDGGGDGPFGDAYDTMREAVVAHGLQWTHCAALPTPRQDGIAGNIRKDEVCGCAHARQFVRWFPRPVRQAIAPLGFRLSVYDVPDSKVRCGGHQVVFRKDAAKLVAR